LDIFIKWDNELNSIQLPINPESFEQSVSQNNTSLYIHELGEINLKGKRALKQVSWSSFFPAQDYNFCRCVPMDPFYYTRVLEALLENNTTVHVIITTTDINMYCTIEEFTHGEADRSGDVSYSITFKEYREVQGGVRTSKDKVPVTYLWRSGDTWPKVTKAVLGDSAGWEAQKSANKKIIKAAKKANKKKKEEVALVGYKVVISP
jgi:nucleoid-associated protein YgaU